MKNPEAIGRVFAAKRRARPASSGWKESLRAKWRIVTDALAKNPKVWSRVLIAIPVLWIFFDFVSFSFGTLPASPESIQVSGQRRVAAEQIRTEILHKLRAKNAENLIEVDLTDVSENLTKNIPAIRSATITKNIGRGVMTVAVVERTGVALIRNSGAVLEVDREGMLYRTRETAAASLPLVDGLVGSAILAGRNLSENPSGAGLLRMLNVFSPKLLRQLKSVHVVRPDYFELEFSGGILVKADPATFPDKVDRVQKILQRVGSGGSETLTLLKDSSGAKEEPRAVAYIDIRFQQDVIAYKTEAPTDRMEGVSRGSRMTQERPQDRGSKKGR